MPTYDTTLDGKPAERTEGASALIVFAEQVEAQLDALERPFGECDIAGRFSLTDDRAHASVFARSGGAQPLFTIAVQRARAAEAVA